MLLIVAGLALLGEWALDMRRKTPVRRSGGFVGILILLALWAVGGGAEPLWGPFGATGTATTISSISSVCRSTTLTSRC